MRTNTFKFLPRPLFLAAVIAASRFSAVATVMDNDANIGNGNNFSPGIWSSIAGGGGNTMFSDISTIGGGTNNTIATNSLGGFIGAGLTNYIGSNAPFNFIGGGATNYIGSNAPFNFVGGGYQNSALDTAGFVGGGEGNFLNAEASVICGGQTNSNYGYYAAIVGGTFNSIPATSLGNGDFIGGGVLNTNYAGWSSIVGGYSNTIASPENNLIYGAFIGGGFYNTVFSLYNGAVDGAIVSGQLNTNLGPHSFIGAGWQNYIEQSLAVINGGSSNNIYGTTFHATAHAASTISGGTLNVISNAVAVSIGGGLRNFAGGQGTTIPGGQYASATNYGQQAYASGAFAAAGDAQTSTYVVRNTTTSATQTELYLDGSSALMQLPDNTTWTFDILVTGRSSTGGNTGSWQILGCIEKTSGTTTIVGGVSVTSIAQTVPTWSATADADNADGALVVNVTGDTSTIRWVATVRTAEVTN